MAKIKRNNLNQAVYIELKDILISNRFKPGERINVEKLSKELGTSRTPIWDAMRRLEQEGLVVNKTNKGIYMNTLTLKEALDLFSIRKNLEGMAVTLAAESIDKHTLSNLEKILTNQIYCIEQEDIDAYTREDYYFHTIIHKASKNNYLAQILNNIENIIRPFAPHKLGFLSDFHEEHQDIFKALKQGDPKSAKKAFDRHNRHVIRTIKKGDLGYYRPDHQL